MNTLRFRLRFYLIVLLVIIVFGTIAFRAIEGVTLTEAFYFIVVTIATVGYGDIHPVTDAGRLLTIILIVLGVGTFLGVVANATELMLNRREQQSITNKINMLIGVFFSEAGTKLIHLFSDNDPDMETIRDELQIRASFKAHDFDMIQRHLANYPFDVTVTQLDLAGLCSFLQEKRPLLIGLLVNPTLLEHTHFTDLLRAVFHLTEELGYRADFGNLPASDREHLAGDIKRAYKKLVEQWVMYMKYLKVHYPYLFSLAVRMSPYDRSASPVVGSSLTGS